ncbi:hypothetical protein Q5762_34200 [Streptomyces sp. P9(2023)]|uniref:hypothetical protein n=1 Tax=Streptomyces sp. P9(2023) TaxID=3064394 RepID=UPI0028F3F108|nr:hypothetical protein [Streptomyces sp. P9(2023)]MDT9693292.1 hypothetical protein [Streptomyces sp. P9(2023)]
MSEELNTATEPEAEPKKPRRARKLLTVVLPAVLVLGAVGGGVTYTAVTVDSADRSAETVAWEGLETSAADEDPAEQGLGRGKASTPLSKLLLPVPDGYVLGPDVESYGNDDELSEQEARALLKQEGKGLSGKKRREYEKDVDKLGLKGVAVRSFASKDDTTVVYIRISQMKDKKGLRTGFELSKKLFDAFDFPKGPKISGHKNSACYLLPPDEDVDKEDKAKQLEQMTCVAYDSEVSVTVTVAGSKPFRKNEVADLVKKQLDHIKSPGEYV